MLRTHLQSSNGSPCQTPPWKKPSLTHRCTGSLPSSKSSAACPTSPPSCAYQHRLEEHKLAEQILQTVNELLTERGLLLKVGTAIDATLIAAPISTKNKNKARDPEMHSSKKGNQWYFGMKAHIGVDADSGLVHSVRGTSGHVSDIAEGNSLLHGQETLGIGDAGYQGIEKRPDAKMGITWHIAMRPGKRKS